MKYSRRQMAFFTTLLVLLLCLAAGIRFYHLGGQSLWSDEGNSAALSTRSFAQIAHDAAQDIHPPLYYWLLKVWTDTFGRTEAALRALSALCGVLSVLAVAELARQMYGEPTGLAAALIATVAPFQVYYSQEARMYMLLALLSALSFLIFWALIQRQARTLDQPLAPPVPLGQPHPSLHAGGRRGRVRFFTPLAVLLGLTWAAGLYTHYSFPIVMGLAGLLYLGWVIATWRAGQGVRRLLVLVVAGMVAVAAFLPWLPTALHQLLSWPTGGQHVNAGAALQTTLAVLGYGPVEAGHGDRWWVWLLAALALIGALPWRRFQPRSAPAAVSAPASSTIPAPRMAEPAAPLGQGGAVSVQTGAATPPPAPNTEGGPAGSLRAAADKPERQTACPAAARGAALSTSALAWLLPIAWALGPVVMMLALGLFRDAYLKFLLVASPAYCLLLARSVAEPAALLSRAPVRGVKGAPVRPGIVALRPVASAAWVVATLGVIVVLAAGVLVRYFTDPTVARDNYRAIAQFITATAQPNDAILLSAPGQEEVFRYYYRGSLPVYPLPRQRPPDPTVTAREMNELLRRDKVYAVYWGSQEADPAQIVESWMDSRGYKTLDQWQGNVRLAVYVMPERRAPDITADGLNQSLGPDIMLLGYRAWNLAPAAGEVTQLQLIWQAQHKPATRYKVFVQLLDPHDQVIAQRDAEPVGESRPTDTWAAGETITDNHGLLIRPGTPPGIYRRIIGMYDPATGQRLRLPDGKDYISLPPIKVTRSATAPSLSVLDMQRTQSFDFGGITLLGYDRYKRGFQHAPDTPIYPGDRLHLTFYWRANVQPRADWWFNLALDDGAGYAVANLQAPLVADTYSTTLWQSGEIVRGEHDLVIPEDLPPDTYRLSLTLLPDTDTPAGVAYLGTVRIQPK